MTSGGRTTDTQRRGERVARMRREQAREERRRRMLAWGLAGGLAAALAGALVWAGVTSAGSAAGQDAADAAAVGQTPPGSLAPAWTGLHGQVIEGVGANEMEQLAYHIHAHLTIYVDGKHMLIPWGVGIVRPWATEPLPGGGEFIDGGMGYYYVHTHDDTGVIHIESPTRTTYTLGQFFAVWDQPLSATRVGPARGPVTVYVDGAPYAGDPAGITLTKHEEIQLDVGRDVPFQHFSFPPGL